MAWYAWGILGIIFFAAEVAIPGIFVFCFFGASALIVGTLVALNLLPSVELQYLLFSLASIVLVFSLRKKFLSSSTNVLNPDDRSQLVGEILQIPTALSPGETAKAQVRGTSWTIRNMSETTLPKGSQAKVIAVSGLTLEIK